MNHLVRFLLILFLFSIHLSFTYGQNANLANGKIMDSVFVHNLNLTTKIQEINDFLADKFQNTKDSEFMVFNKFMNRYYSTKADPQAINNLKGYVLQEYKAYPNLQARFFNQIAYMNFVGLQNFERAFDAYLLIEDILSQNGPTVITRYAYYCSQISSAYYKFKDYKRAIHFGKMGLKYADNKWDMFNTIGLCYTALNQLDSSNLYLNKAIEEARKLNLPRINHTISQGNIGVNYYYARQIKLAYPLLMIDFQEAQKFQDWGLAAGSSIPLSHIYIIQKNYKKADSLLTLTREYIQKSKQFERLEKYYPIKALYYEEINDLKRALAYRDSSLKAYKYNDSVYNGLLVLRVQQRADLTKIEREKLKLQNYQEVVKIQFIAIGVVVILLGIGYYLYRNYLFRLQQNRQRIEELNRLLNLRQRLSADMHDDIGSSLSSISLYSHSLLMQPQSPEQKYVLTKIKENAQYIQEQVNDIIWSVNPKMDVMKELVARMRKFGAEITESANIAFIFDCTEEIMDLEIEMAWRRNLFLMYKEAIHNAIKYSQAEEIKVELKFQSGKLNIQIADNGIGFDTDKIIKGNGLKNLQARAKIMDAFFQVESIRNKGTKVIIKSPIR